MGCRTARLLLEFARPRLAELPPDDGDALDAHLAGCAECDTLARAEREADARLRQAMQAVALPEGLRDRLLARLERDRAEQRRRWVGWTVRLAAAAALLFAVSLLVYHWYASKKPELDLANLLFVNSDVISQDREKVEKGFLDHYEVKTTTPVAFNYAFLKFYAIADCQGKRVPFLYFQRRETEARITEARVYVVSSDQFNLANLEPGEHDESGGSHVAVMRDDPDHAFVIVYKGESLLPLLRDDNEA